MCVVLPQHLQGWGSAASPGSTVSVVTAYSIRPPAARVSRQPATFSAP
jgi:hypothetical protein